MVPDRERGASSAALSRPCGGCRGAERMLADVFRIVGGSCHARYMVRAVIPEWAVPAEATVRLVRHRAGGWWESSGGEARYVGVIRSLDWVAGVRAESPVTEYAEPAVSPSRVLVEVL